MEENQTVLVGRRLKEGLSGDARLSEQATGRGTELRYIQQLLGHQSPNTTAIYTHVSTKNLQNITSPFDQITKGNPLVINYLKNK